MSRNASPNPDFQDDPPLTGDEPVVFLLTRFNDKLENFIRSRAQVRQAREQSGEATDERKRHLLDEGGDSAAARVKRTAVGELTVAGPHGNVSSVLRFGVFDAGVKQVTDSLQSDLDSEAVASSSSLSGKK